MAGCSALQEFEDQLFCRAGVQRSAVRIYKEFTSLRLGKVKIFEFVIKSFWVSRCIGCDFFRRRG